MGAMSGDLSYDEKHDLALRNLHRLNQERRKAIGRRMLIEMYRAGKITLERLRKAGIEVDENVATGDLPDA